MNDEAIIALYFQRDEEAIRQTDAAHGKKLHNLSLSIVKSAQDASECVNDTYLKAWQTIPPQKPNYLFAYLAKICRFLSFGRLDYLHAGKRSADFVTLTEEMQQCIPDNRASWAPEQAVLTQILNRFLSGLSPKSRVIFLRRYWYADSIAQIAVRCHMSQSAVKTQLHRTREKLRTFLEQEGIAV